LEERVCRFFSADRLQRLSDLLKKPALLKPWEHDRPPPFTLVDTITLGTTHLMILVRTKFAHLISNIKSESLAVGWFNTFSNKSSLGISFRFGQNKMLVLNSHFNAHIDGRRRRNEQWVETFNHFIHDFEDEGSGIGGFLTCGGTDVIQPLKVIANKKTYADHRAVRNGALDDKFDAIIWVGDFNSRI